MFFFFFLSSDRLLMELITVTLVLHYFQLLRIFHQPISACLGDWGRTPCHVGYGFEGSESTVEWIGQVSR
jgi:hypothetical protein